MKRQLHLSLDLNVGRALADYLNRHEAGGNPDSEIAAYVRWANGAKRGGLPSAVRGLFTRPFSGQVSRSTLGLEILGRAHADNALWSVSVLERSGSLERIRECPQCGKWFYAGNKKTRFSSPACRSAYFAAHSGKERAKLINRKWRIVNLHCPNVRKHVTKLEGLKRPRTKSETVTLERGRSRLDALERELRQINLKLAKSKRR
jgi:hypothetical protein